MRFDPYSELFALVARVDDEHAQGSIGDETPPEREPLQFLNEHLLAFVSTPASVVNTAATSTVAIESALFGLLGPIGPLPYFYSEAVARAERSNETALRDFLSVFSHRATSLMYRAWRDSRMALEHHPGAGDSRQEKFTHLFEAFSGASDMPKRIAWLDLQGRLPVAAPDLFLRRVRNAKGLRQLLQRQFGMRFEIEEFVGNWESIPEDARSALGVGAPQLGRNTLLGRRVWQVQSTFAVVVRYPTVEQYARLQPGSESLRRIQLAVRMYCTADLCFRLRIVVSGKTLKTGGLGAGGAMLGWNTVAGSPDPGRDYVFSICRDYNANRMAQ